MLNRIYFLLVYGLFLCLISTEATISPSLAGAEFYVIAAKSTTFKGNWSIIEQYTENDIVYYNGSSWFSLKGNNKGNQPDLYPAYWTLFAKKGDNGTNGTNGTNGATGPQGPAGPAVHTSAVCVSASVTNADCSCSVRTISNVRTYQTCTVTSDTGSCTAGGVQGYSGPSYYGSCCVCAPN